jgi:hypothetical protein
MAATWLAGVAAFALVAAPWVAVLSAKYGRLTFGTAAGQTYAQFAPGAGDLRLAAITGLRKPPEDAYSVWQDARLDLPADWRAASPFRSLAALKEQVRMVRRNLAEMLGHLAGLDLFRLSLGAVALTPLAFALTCRRREIAFRHLAALLTLGVFCGGYAFLHADEERFFWFPVLLMPSISLQFVALAARAVRRLAPRMEARRPGLPAAALGLLAVVSFGGPSYGLFRELLGAPPPGREHRLVARRLAEWGARGPLASTDWHDGLHTAYYLDAQYAGMPASPQPEHIAARMREVGARTLLVWGKPRLAAALRAEPAFEPIGVIPASSLTGLRVDVAVFALRPET